MDLLRLIVMGLLMEEMGVVLNMSLLKAITQRKEEQDAEMVLIMTWMAVQIWAIGIADVLMICRRTMCFENI